MKALVLYDTKHGSTAEAAAEIARGLGGGELLRLSDAKAFSALGLDAYDLVAVGGPIYFGQWSKRAASFLAGREAELAGLGSAGRLALFALGSAESEGPEAVKAALPASLVALEPEIGWFGGRLPAEGLSLMERLVVKLVSRSGAASRPLDLEAARAFGAGLGLGGPTRAKTTA